MSPITVPVRDLKQKIGQEIGRSEYLEVRQARIDQFAEATGDRQWIHVDRERARQESPYRNTIAHGFLTLSLLSKLLSETVAVSGVRMSINYGLNRVRFPAAVPSDSRIRALVRVSDVQEISNSLQVQWEITVEREGGSKPCCIAEWLVRYYVS